MLENNKGRSKWAIQSNWQHIAHKTQDEQSKNTTPLCASKHMSTHTNNWKRRRTEHRFYVEILGNITLRISERKATY